jgi:hypothetical protein
VDAVLPLAADGVVLAGTCHPNGRLAAALA